MTPMRTRDGFTLVELLLFLGLAAIMGGTLISVYIATQEARLRQQGIAGVEQRGIQIVELITRNIRRAETIVDPASGGSGSILALQMGLNAEFPTIIAPDGSGNLLIVQKTSTAALLPGSISIDQVSFSNIDNGAAQFSFDLTAHIPSVPPATYTKTFRGSATLLPDDVSDAGGCGSCPAPVCTNGQYQWYHCIGDTCTQSTVQIYCE